jgi:phospholipid/cholesterol/gamma-HCH transport system substrate-binding protein
MNRKLSKEIRVGGVIVVGLAIMIGAVFFIGGQGTFFGGKVKYKILFKSTAGLYEGDPVLLTGVEVGNVEKIGFPQEIEQKNILVEIAVAKEAVSRIREDSIVGNTSLVLEDLRRVLLKIDQSEGVMGILLNEPMEIRETFHHLSVSAQKLSSLMGEIDSGKGALGTLLSDSMDVKQTMMDLETASADLKEITTRLKGKDSALGKLINDKEYGEALTKDLLSAVHSLANIAAKIDTGKGTVGCLINDDDLFIGLQDVVLGIERSKLSKWIIQNRRKSGEDARMREQKKLEKKNAN